MHLTDERRRRLLRAAAAVATAPWLTRAAGRSSLDVRILVGESGEATASIIKAITKRFPDANVVESTVGPNERRSDQVYFALGTAALQSVIASGTTAPVLALFTSNEAYARVVGGAEKRLDNISALFAEASPLHQLKLARSLYKRRIGVTALFSSSTMHLQPVVELAARSTDVELHVRVLETGDNVVQAILSQRDTQALLMIPDRNLYTSDNLRNVLESTYRRQLGVIGFSPSLVRAGALAAAYSTIEDVLAQAGSVADTLISGRAVPPQYPAFWRVLINDRVANSLDVVVDDADRALGNIASGT